MSTLLPTGKSEWQPGHFPRLSYRNPLPADETLPQKAFELECSPIKKFNNTGLSIREIREALPRDISSASCRIQLPSPISPSQKSKKSLFGGFFVKEPSMAALDQVAHNMMAQHGSTTAATIPYVSSQKMPDFVPKVNSKWDGVPDYIRVREKEERERQKIANRNSLRPINSRSQSNGIQDEKIAFQRRNSNAASTSDSWDSRSTGSRPLFHDNMSMHPASIYSNSSCESVHHLQHTISTTTVQSHATFASARSPASSSSYLDAPSTTQKARRLKSSQSSSDQSVGSSDQSRFDRSPRMAVPPVDAIPEYTFSSATTPLERSPQTPALYLDDENSLDTVLQGESMLPASLANKSHTKSDRNVKTIQTRSTSTTKAAARTGLTLQTNNLVAPWESQAVSPDTAKSPKYGTPLSPRGKGRIFGRDKK